MKKFLTLFLVLVLVTMPLTVSFAADKPSALVANKPIYSFQSGLQGTINNTAAKIAGIIQVVGIAIALVVLVAFGVQWLIATPAKKADLKGKLWNILIGLIILLLGTTILNTVIGLISGMDSSKPVGGDSASEPVTAPSSASGSEPDMYWP